MLILGLDPSLSCTGWGIIRSEGARIVHVANGQIATQTKAPMARRLAALHSGIAGIIAEHAPDRAAAEEVFANKNAQSTLKLAQARGAVLTACGGAGLTVNEHAARKVKKAVVGTGAAEKAQIQAMLKVLLPGAAVAGPDAADALAVAIADAHLTRSHGGPAEMIYIVKNLVPISAATLVGLVIGLAWLSFGGFDLPAPGIIILAALCEFSLASILAGALILAPAKAGEWTMALGSAFIIWIGFIAPAFTATLAVAGESASAIVSIGLHWLIVMLMQAVTMKAIGLTPPPDE